MKQTDRREAGHELTEVERLLTEDQRRTISVDDHARFIEATRPTDRFDEIDHAAADVKPAQRRSEADTSRVLKLLDELDAANGEERAR